MLIQVIYQINSACLFLRDDLKKLLHNLNKQKDKLKKMGITVDGKHYRVQFKGNYDRLLVYYFNYEKKSYLWWLLYQGEKSGITNSFNFRVECTILTQCWHCLAFNIGLLFVPFLVTLDYKGLVLLMAKIEDEDFLLGGRGLCVEFCIFCFALRVSLDYAAKHIVTDFSLVQFVCCAIYIFTQQFIFAPVHDTSKKKKRT